MILTVVSTIVSFSLMLGGILMKISANKPISETVGFRTHKAMLNVTNWHNANSKCGSLWLLTGAAGFALTMLIPLVIMPRLNTNADVLLQILPLAAQIITSAACAVHVERSLK
ncbi:MAG: SdpI family protein [Ruminococcus sp.]|jgi:uncharacterized membrane protein|nr:SdpI family protein [Ruminococcus sp.]MBQ3937461.1 SdpI family protein [Ruminococcus sp.]